MAQCGEGYGARDVEGIGKRATQTGARLALSALQLGDVTHLHFEALCQVGLGQGAWRSRDLPVGGDDAERVAAFRAVRDDLRSKIAELFAEARAEE